jgi:flavin reductase (DIM6/NTAB) family NADH-FMN oxidoreductase RutF
MIGECPVNIECRLKDIIRLGSHDLFLGEVVAVHADESVLDDNGNIDFAKAAPLVYNQGEYWDLGAKVGAYGCSR